MRRTGVDGFSLVEAVFAVTLLSVGLLAVAAMLNVAGNTLARARELQDSASTISDVADSMALFGAATSGSRDHSWGTLTWTVRLRGALADVRFVARSRDAARAPLAETDAIVRSK